MSASTARDARDFFRVWKYDPDLTHNVWPPKLSKTMKITLKIINLPLFNILPPLASNSCQKFTDCCLRFGPGPKDYFETINN